jgi:hypothetical protein
VAAVAAEAGAFVGLAFELNEGAGRTVAAFTLAVVVLLLLEVCLALPYWSSPRHAMSPAEAETRLWRRPRAWR